MPERCCGTGGCASGAASNKLSSSSSSFCSAVMSAAHVSRSMLEATSCVFYAFGGVGVESWAEGRRQNIGCESERTASKNKKHFTRFAQRSWCHWPDMYSETLSLRPASDRMIEWPCIVSLPR